MSAGQLIWRDDLVVSPQETTGERTFVVKDPASGRFFRLREMEHFIARQLDGSTSLDELRGRVEAEFESAVPAETLERFVERLRGLGLLANGRSAAPRRVPGRISGDVFYIRVKAFDPDRLFTWVASRVQCLFTAGFVASSAALIVVALGLTVLNWAEISREFLDLFRFESLLLAWVITLAVIALHEFAHGVTCKQFGGQVRELGFLLLYFQPAFYCNVSDAWLFPEKSKRLWVTFAGAYFELFLWAVSTVIWRLTDPSTALNHLALVVTATSAIKSLFNLNPLIKLDGYYLLSDWLEIPNLRRKAFDYLRSSLTRWCRTGSGEPPAVPRRKRSIYLVYGLLAALYTYWLLAWVATQVGGYLVARYEAWGFALFVALLTGLARHPIRRSWARVRAACNGGAGKLRVATRLAKAILILDAMFAGLYFWRLELKVSGEFTILPIRHAEVRAEVEGIIEKVQHDEGDAVRPGDVIVCLNERDLRAEWRKLEAEIAEKRAKMRMLKAGPRPEEIELARTAVTKAEQRLQFARNQFARDSALFEQTLLSRRDFEVTEEEGAVRQKEWEEAKNRLKVLLAGPRPEEIEALEAELSRFGAQQRYLEEQIKLLTVTSPVAGVITTRRLKEKVGQLVEKGDLIAEVHELNTVTAEIAVSEKDIADVHLGQRVFLKARAHPQRSFEGTVTAIAPVATPATDWRGQRTVLVVTRLDNAAQLLRPEMSGRAKVYCGEQRALALLLRRLVRYLRVEFWSWW